SGHIHKPSCHHLVQQLASTPNHGAKPKHRRLSPPTHRNVNWVAHRLTARKAVGAPGHGTRPPQQHRPFHLLPLLCPCGLTPCIGLSRARPRCAASPPPPSPPPP